MAIITLTSDLGLKDFHVAAMKGAILSELPNVNIIDVSHQISPFNLIETAYIVRNAIKSFPKNTVNIISVDVEYSRHNKLIVARIENQYFVSADNGILSFLTYEISDYTVYEITIIDENEACSNSTLVRAACHLARGGKMEVIGKVLPNPKELKVMAPMLSDDGNKLIGSVVYIDNYGNVVTNITRNYFNTVKGNNTNFEITARNHKWNSIQNKYNDIENFDSEVRETKDGKKLVLFNSAGFLEVAIYRSNLKTVGGASTLLGLKYHDSVTINFSK
ncbi:MAG: SAM-dependent chlorinase/fluorinase [Flavobacteriales bacterium]|nr:SAM-dependent chlorinase/fluorinase [Flavobacteriales bacterium]